MGTRKADKGEITELLNRCDVCLAYASQPGDHSEDCFRFKGRRENDVIIYNQKASSAMAASAATTPTAGATVVVAGGAVSGGSGKRPATKHKHTDDDCDVIGELMGQYGKYQFVMTFLLSLFQVPNTFHIASSIYQSADKIFWCKRPAHLQDIPVSVWRNISGSADNCHQFVNSTFGAIQSTFTTLQTPEALLGIGAGELIKCTAWEYSVDDVVGNTWVSEWDLVCDQQNLKSVAEMFFLAGVATGGIISGYSSDRFGRKKMLFISVVLQTIFGMTLYFVHSLHLYLVLRGLLGLVSVSVTYAGLILAIEFVDGKWRTIAGMYNLFPLPLSYMVISGLAYATQDFRQLQLFIGIPGFFLCFLWFVIPESPRWLLCKGRVAEVRTIIRSACEFNGRPVPDNMDKILRPPVRVPANEGCTNLFRSSYLRLITLCFLGVWFAMNLVYYGLLLNMNEYGINVYLITALAGLVEIPAIGTAILIIMKVGKKWFFCSTFMAAGVACLCVAGLDYQFANSQNYKIAFLLIGKFTISAGNTIMPVYTAELYPTAIRNAGVGACNLAAGLALIGVPYLPVSIQDSPNYLMLILTGVSLVGGVIVMFLPEHERKAMDETDEERC